MQDPRRAGAPPAAQIIQGKPCQRNGRLPRARPNRIEAIPTGVYAATDVADTRPQPLLAKRGSIWLIRLLALAAFAAAGVLAWRSAPDVPDHATLTAGSSITTRALIARSLAQDLAPRGIVMTVVEVPNTFDELDAVTRREIDFAMVSGLVDRKDYPELREVAPLFVEALHLLVKDERAAAFADQTLEGLRGLRVDLGPLRSATGLLAEDVLRFARIPCTPAPTPTTCGATHSEIEALVELATRGDRDALPDALFHLSSVPSKIALDLIENHQYTLVPLPFANAFRLAGLLSDEDGNPVSAAVERRSTTEFLFSPYLYGTAPPVPAEPMVTIGAQLVLVAHRDLSPQLVEQVVETVFETRFARVPDPSLNRALLDDRPQAILHAGTKAYLARGRPIIAARDMDRLANSMSVLGALIGGSLFVWEAWRRRKRAARDLVFSGYQLEIASVERRIAELELAAELELEPLVELQRALLKLKSDALTRFSEGALGDQASLTDLLSPLNAARDHVGDLLLHVRDNLESQALRQGRSAEAVWEEAIEGSEPRPDGE